METSYKVVYGMHNWGTVKGDGKLDKIDKLDKLGKGVKLEKMDKCTDKASWSVMNCTEITELSMMAVE